MIKVTTKQRNKLALVAFSLAAITLLWIILFNGEESVYSASTDNVSGWAWSETIGWISFNNTSGGGGINYGVNVDAATGNFSGYAWSENIGWISFNRADTGNPPAAPYNGGSGPIANFDFVSKRVRGWARALAADGNGWDGWIKLGDGGVWPGGGNPPSNTSQVWVDTTSSPDELRGWAWGSDVVGWISFNCADRPGNLCATSNYKVLLDINFPPDDPSDLTRTNPDWCDSPPRYYFTWTYSDDDGDDESQFDFQILEAGVPVVSRLAVPSSTPSGGQNTQAAIVAVSLSDPDIHYGRTYSWRAKVYDSGGLPSEWSNGASFITEPHHYPYSDFTLSPSKPSAEENVQFTDQSTCYDNIITGSNCAKPDDWYSWTFTGPGTAVWDADFGDARTLENPVVSFSDQGAWNVKLEVTDSDNPSHKCDITKPVNVSLPSPEWKEIIPR